MPKNAAKSMPSLCVSIHFKLKQNVKISRSSYHSNFENEMNSAIQKLIELINTLPPVSLLN